MRIQRPSELATALCLLLSIPMASAFYLPGVAPTTYRKSDLVPLYVNRLTPSRSLTDGQVHSVMSYDYYLPPFHFCQPQDGPKSVSESLGSIIFGDRIQTSPFELRMLQNETCKVPPNCGMQTFEPMDAKVVNNRIWQGYDIHWLVDGLPAAELIQDTEGSYFYSPGFRLGVMDEQRPTFHNHYDILVQYHEVGEDKYRVVGILVVPASNRNALVLSSTQGGECDNREPLVLSEDDKTRVVFTYSVFWAPSDTPFATRWDKYLHVFNPKIHWVSLINGAVIVVFLCTMVFVVLVRTLRKDITRYNKLDQYVLDDLGSANGTSAVDEGVQEDSGWKLVHGDVFRPPKQPLLLAVLVGNGAQLFMMAGFTIAFAMFGFLSPSNRGSIGSTMVILYTLFGGIGGFVSTYTYKCLGAEDRWKHNMILTPLALPLLVFSTFFMLNLFIWAKGSSGAVPFTTMLILVLVWFIISVPLSLAGSWLALKRPPIEAPVRTNQIPRQIPDAVAQGGSGLGSWLNRPIPAILLTGILPFGAIIVELHFIMSSLWSARIYYMFGFLFICYGLMIVTCAAVTVLNIYFVLCSENYHWQWRSFATSGACSIYFFLNALIFWITRLRFGSLTSGVLYLGYSTLISILVFILTGTIGFFASWMFVHRIYRSIKID